MRRELENTVIDLFVRNKSYKPHNILDNLNRGECGGDFHYES